jgi:hypothetical protein
MGGVAEVRVVEGERESGATADDAEPPTGLPAVPRLIVAAEMPA